MQNCCSRGDEELIDKINTDWCDKITGFWPFGGLSALYTGIEGCSTMNTQRQCSQPLLPTCLAELISWQSRRRKIVA